MQAESTEVPAPGRCAARRAAVSVGLPTYNRRASFERAAASVLSQVGDLAVELVVSDNASTDDTWDAVEALDDRPEVTAVRQSTNIGPTENFRAVAAMASGDHFMWLGDDDWLDPTYLSECVAELERDPTVAMVAGVATYHDGDDSWTEAQRVSVHGRSGFQRVLQYYRQVAVNGVFYGVVRGDVARALPPLPNLMGGDWLHVASVAFHGGVTTLDGASVHRSVGGATASLADVARHAGLGWFQRTAPQLAIAGFVLRDIGWDNPTYRPLGRIGRLWLGLRAAAIVFRRFVPGAVAKFIRLRAGSGRSQAEATP